METQGPTIMQKNPTGRFVLPNFKFYHKATIIKTVWSRHNDIKINEIEIKDQK